MPDITFVSPPFLGHLIQMLALAENLAARGHVVHVVTSHTRAQEVHKAGAKLIPWEIADDGEALTAVWRHATRAQAWAGERIMLSYLVEHYDTIYEFPEKVASSQTRGLLRLRPRAHSGNGSRLFGRYAVPDIVAGTRDRPWRILEVSAPLQFVALPDDAPAEGCQFGAPGLAYERFLCAANAAFGEAPG